MFDNIATSIAVQNSNRAFDFAQSKFNVAISRLTLDEDDTRFLKAITDGGAKVGYLSMAHFAGRRASSEAMIAALVAYAAASQASDPLQLWLGTYCFDDGVTWLRAPRVSLSAIKRKIDKSMRAHGLHGVYCVEVEILLAIDGERAPRLLFHVHMACWRKQDSIRPRKLAQRIMDSKSFSNRMGADSVRFTTASSQSKTTIAGLAGYITKFPACVKQRRPDGYGSFKLTHEQAKYSPRMMLRMIEILSHIPLYDAVRGVGEGKVVRRAWKRQMTAWRALQRASEEPLSRTDVSRGWKAVRFRAKLKGKRCRIKL